MTAKLTLDPTSLAAKVSLVTYDRGLGVYRSQCVQDVDFFQSDSRVWQIEGEVKGSERQPYWVDVSIEVNEFGQVSFFKGECSCPLGNNCKHAVAITLKAAYRSGGVVNYGQKSSATDAVRGNPPPPPSVDAGAAGAVVESSRAHHADQAAAREAMRHVHAAAEQERQQALAKQKINAWLDLFDDLEPAVSAGDAAPQAGKRKPAINAERFVFLLMPRKAGHLLRLELGYATSRPLAGGGWAKAKVPRYTSYAGQAVYDEAPAGDLEAIRLISALASGNYGGTSGQLVGQTGQLALQFAANSGRLFATDSSMILTQALTVGPTLPIEWVWHEMPQPEGREPLWAVKAELARRQPGQMLFANEPALYLAARQGEVGLAQTEGMGASQQALLFNAPPLPAWAFEHKEGALLRHLAGLALPPIVQPPQPWPAAMPIAHLFVSRAAASDAPQLGMMRAQLQFDYGGLRGYWAHQKIQVMVETPPAQAQLPSQSTHSARSPITLASPDPSPASTAPPQRWLLRRDLSAEATALNKLLALGLHEHLPGYFYQQSDVTGAHWLAWADSDFALLREAGFEVSSDIDLHQLITRADDLQVSLQGAGNLAEGEPSPWFDLSLGMDIAGQRRNILPWLPDLLAQLKVGSTGSAELPPFVYAAQPDGSFVRLPTAPLKPWLQALLDLMGSSFAGEALRLSRLDALRVGASLGQGAVWEGAQSLRDMVQQLVGHSALPEVPVPSTLQASLRPYQQQGLNWLQFLRQHGLHGILADDMGLGKTLQTLAHVLVEKEAGRLTRPALIVAPVSLMGNWRREAARFTPTLRTLVLHGKDRHDAALEITTHDLVIAPYSLLQRDRERWLAQAWHLVVLDEAQNIKNATSHAAQVVGEMNAANRLCLSGTPMENHLGELWSLFHFLMPGFLGSQARFKALFRTPIEKNGDHERLVQLRSRITPFMLRRTKKEVASELPDKIETLSSVELQGKQADLYETIRLSTEKAVQDALSNKGLAKSQIQILDALLKLRQVCCDPRLLPLESAKKIKQSAKLEHLMALLPEMLAEGRKVLLFSQFTTMLALIEDELRERDIPWVKLTGQSQKRDDIIARFTSGEVPLFLISLKAGGVGLNLPQADTVIHYDPWWNPAAENQATDRAHRIGQTSQVFVYKLVAQGTIEERILALQERKAALAQSVYSGSAARKQPLFTESDVMELLKPLG